MGTSVDHNSEKWTDIFGTEEEAQAELERHVSLLAKNKRIVSAKKELQPNKTFRNKLFYKFIIITASKCLLT
jgi:hypothetical protein